MLYILHGPDTYRSRQKLNDIIREYRNKTGANFEVYRFDAEEDDPARIRAVAEAGSLFSAKRLIVVSYPFSPKADFDSFEKIACALKESRDVFLVFWDRELPATSAAKLAKIKSYAKKSEEFPLLAGTRLERWINEEMVLRGITLTREEKEAFLSWGGDLWKIANEMDRRVFAREWRMSTRGADVTVFALGDTFFISLREGLRTLFQLLEKGEDGMGLFSYLANHARTLFVVKACAEHRVSLPQSFGIHPFVAQKARAVVRAMPFSRFPVLLYRFWEEDRRIKTGESSAEDSLLRILVKK